jgi:hypothetical protein
MQTTIIKGNKSTTPRGTETAEFPFNRRGRLKNAHLDEDLLLFPASFIVGKSVAVGKRFIARRTTSIAAKVFRYRGYCIIRMWTSAPGVL